MPLVFVHGVANRFGGKLAAQSTARDAYARRFLLRPPLWPEGAEPTIHNPYWGGLGATLAWGGASIPRPGEAVEELGADESAHTAPLTAAVAAFVPAGSDEDNPLLAAARVQLADAVDLLCTAAALEADVDVLNGMSAAAIAETSATAIAYALRHPRPEWLESTADDTQFLTRLQRAVTQDAAEQSAIPGSHSSAGGDTTAGWEQLGVDKVWSGFREIGSRMRRRGVNRAVERPADRLRSAVVPRMTEFLGDVLVYLGQRGRTESDGTIATAIAGVLSDAWTQRRDDDPLMVIAHSMGGNIVHDVLTRHPDARGVVVDTLVTVGSQVGFFEELGLFGPHPGIPGPAAVRLPQPRSVRRWINVFDYNDLLSFKLAPIIDGVEDCAYRTGQVRAHSAYFLQPQFYAHLADRLGQQR
jgi:hypothetical protein